MKYFCSDGTFEKSPKQFYQVYSLHAIHHQLPQKMEATLIAFALMKTKTENDYRRFFELLSAKVQEEFGNQGVPKVNRNDNKPKTK
jgi:hypothetical protein